AEQEVVAQVVDRTVERHEHHDDAACPVEYLCLAYGRTETMLLAERTHQPGVAHEQQAAPDQDAGMQLPAGPGELAGNAVQQGECGYERRYCSHHLNFHSAPAAGTASAMTHVAADPSDAVVAQHRVEQQ